MIILLCISVLFQQISTGYAFNTTEIVPKLNTKSCEDEITFEEVTDPEFLSLFHLAEKCMENVCEETQIKSVTEICQKETNNEKKIFTSSKLNDIIIIAGITTVAILAVTAIVIVCIRKRRARVQRPPSADIVVPEMKLQSLRQGCLRPLPIPEEPRYSYLEILDVPKINKNQMSNSQTSVTADYLEPMEITIQNKYTGPVRRRLPSSNPDDHLYQDLQTYEIMK